MRPVRALAPLFSGPQALRRQLLTSGPTFVTLRPWKRTLSRFRLQAHAPEGQKRFPIRSRSGPRKVAPRGPAGARPPR